MDHLMISIYMAAAGMPAGPRNFGILGSIAAALIALKIARGIIRIVTFTIFILIAAGIIAGSGMLQGM